MNKILIVRSTHGLTDAEPQPELLLSSRHAAVPPRAFLLKNDPGEAKEECCRILLTTMSTPIAEKTNSPPYTSIWNQLVPAF